jgi:hypothetical protein
VELRDGIELVYFKKKGHGRNYILDNIRCLKDTNPFIGDINIFEVGLDKLKEIDSDFVGSSEWLTFRNLGITVGGLGKKKIPEERQVIAFQRESLKQFEVFARVVR